MIKVKANISSEAKGAKTEKRRVHTGIPVHALITDEVLAKLNELKMSLMPKKHHNRHGNGDMHGGAAKGHRVYSSRKKTMHFAPGRMPATTAS